MLYFWNLAAETPNIIEIDTGDVLDSANQDPQSYSNGQRIDEYPVGASFNDTASPSLDSRLAKNICKMDILWG